MKFQTKSDCLSGPTTQLNRIARVAHTNAGERPFALTRNSHGNCNKGHIQRTLRPDILLSNNISSSGDPATFSGSLLQKNLQDVQLTLKIKEMNVFEVSRGDRDQRDIRKRLHDRRKGSTSGRPHHPYFHVDRLRSWPGCSLIALECPSLGWTVGTSIAHTSTGYPRLMEIESALGRINPREPRHVPFGVLPSEPCWTR